jgi:phosphatidylserine/phosphatidylglycerophosphate/cardiolipin synthase-like enzyme
MSSGDQKHDAPSLTHASSDDLGQLADLIESGEVRFPFEVETLGFKGLGHLAPMMRPFAGLGRSSLSAVLGAVLAERQEGTKKNLQLVWSGSDAGPSYARYTVHVVPELISRARRQITIAGYSFDQGAGVFEQLHSVMLAHDVPVRLFVDIDQLFSRLKQQLKRAKRRARLQPLDVARQSGSAAFAKEVLAVFRELYWPHSDRSLDVYYDPRTADHRAFASLHAKCLIIDHEHVLITSANFTGRGQERNIEVGVILHDRGYAQALETQWSNLVESGDVVRG